MPKEISSRLMRRAASLCWHFLIGGQFAPPMAFAVDGKEYVAIAAGSSQYTFGPALKSGYAILNGGSPTRSLVPKKESETHHAAVGGVPNSEHPREKAADIVIEGLTAWEMDELAL
jgi:hypothetical protein